MNNSFFLRLVWKEYRLQRSLWIAMALLTGMLLVVVHLFALNETERFAWQLLLGTSMPALYCIGAGAILFAGEREANTYEFQRSLPVGAARVFAAKMSFVFLSTVAMFMLFGLTLFLLRPAGAFNPSEISHQYAAGVAKRMPLLGIVLLFWTIFFSLLLRRVLVAAVIGVAVGSFYFAIANGWSSRLWDHFRIAPELIAWTVAIVLVDVCFGVRWFRQRKEYLREPKPLSLGAADGVSGDSEYAVITTNGGFIPVGSDRLIIVGRLVWQHWRQSARLITVLVGLTLLPLLMIGMEWLTTGELPNTLWNHKIAQYGPVAHMCGITFGLFPAMLGVVWLGLIAFHSDQWDRGYRFLADRAAPPKYVWLSRQLVCWAAAAVALPGLLLAMYWILPVEIDCSGNLLIRIEFNAPICMAAIGCLVLAVAVGQFFSMFFHSGILAGLFSFIFTFILAVWCGLMWLWNVHWLWSMLPIPVALLLATRLRVREWLLERNTFRAWLCPGLTLVIPTIVLLVAVPLYRVYQIPYVDLGFSPDEYAREITPEERKRASGLMDQAAMLVRTATELESEGKLDEALECYLEALNIAEQNQWDYLIASSIEKLIYERLPIWASRPGQTPDRILAAQGELKQIASTCSVSRAIIFNHMQLRHLFQGDTNTIDFSASFEYGLKESTWLQWAVYWRRFPWERARSLRLLNYWTSVALAASTEVDRRAASGTSLGLHRGNKSSQSGIDSWSAADFFTPDHMIHKYLWEDRVVFRRRTLIEAERRAVRIILALEAWKLQHGSLPNALDELVGTYLDKLPNDPYTDKPFRYFPNGVKHPFSSDHRSAFIFFNAVEISAGEPFLWAAGPDVALRNYPGVGHEIDLHRYAIYDKSHPSDWRRPFAENEIWASGLVFPIP